jgi:hypothetical protein
MSECAKVDTEHCAGCVCRDEQRRKEFEDLVAERDSYREEVKRLQLDLSKFLDRHKTAVPSTESRPERAEIVAAVLEAGDGEGRVFDGYSFRRRSISELSDSELVTHLKKQAEVLSEVISRLGSRTTYVPCSGRGKTPVFERSDSRLAYLFHTGRCPDCKATVKVRADGKVHGHRRQA